MGAEHSSSAHAAASASAGAGDDGGDDDDDRTGAAAPAFSSLPAYTPAAVAGGAGSGTGTGSRMRSRSSGGSSSALTTPYPLQSSGARQLELHVDLAPSQMFVCRNRTPVVVALDMTGSMVVWGKIIFDKLALFSTEIGAHQYLEDPAVSFAFIGDIEFDKSAPLQCTPFAWGQRNIEQQLQKVE